MNKAPVDANSVRACVGAALYAVFSHTLAVTSEAPTLSEHIHCFTKRFECSEIGREGMLVRLALFRARRNHVMFCCPELGFHALSPEGTPAWMIYRRVFADVALGMGRANYVLHASCVADSEGRALLVSGASDSGKTSTLLALLQRGFRYAGDDYSIIGLDDGRLRALPVGVTVNEATFGFFPELEPLRTEMCKFYCQKEWQWTVNPADIFETVSPFAELDIRGVFFLQSAFGSQSQLAVCTPEEALWRLQNEEVQPPRLGRPSMRLRPNGEFLQRRIALARKLVREARFFNIVNGDIQETADLVVASLDT